jgi:hypothetical protein
LAPALDPRCPLQFESVAIEEEASPLGPEAVQAVFGHGGAIDAQEHFAGKPTGATGRNQHRLGAVAFDPDAALQNNHLTVIDHRAAGGLEPIKRFSGDVNDTLGGSGLGDPAPDVVTGFWTCQCPGGLAALILLFQIEGAKYKGRGGIVKGG